MHMLQEQHETEKLSLSLDLLRSRAKQVDTNPTEAQREQGNYRKGHVSWNGLAIAIENPKGSKRKGVDENGKAWESTLKHHYGYFKNSEDNDGDQLDVFINEKYLDSELVFVVNQNNADGSFDEHKCVIGTITKKDAVETYLSNYQAGWDRLGSIIAVPLDRFYLWVKYGKKSVPLTAGELKKPISYAIECEECGTVLSQTRNIGPKDLRTKAGLCEDCAASRGTVIHRRQMVIIKSSEDRSPVVAVDLDGTIAEQMKPYKKDEIGSPRAGAREWLQKFRAAGAVLVIFTVRGNKQLVQDWLEANSMPYDFINYSPYQPDGASDKIMADVYWDDRAICAKDLSTGAEVLEKIKQRG